LRVFLWSRRNPEESFYAGYESTHYLEIEEFDINNLITFYLLRPWLAHPFLDWAFLDISVTQDVCLYGEVIKKNMIQPLNSWGVNRFYEKNQGHYYTLKKSSNLDSLKWLLGLTACIVLLPFLLISSLFIYEYEIAAYIFSGIFLLVMASLLGIFGAKSFIYILKIALDKPTSNKEAGMRIWNEMYKVWQCLDEKVIASSKVKVRIDLATKAGANWNSRTYAMLERIENSKIPLTPHY